MYDIFTLEPENAAVMTACNNVARGVGLLPATNNHYRFIVPGDVHVNGNGGATERILVLVGHGAVNRLSRHNTWRTYADDIHSVDLREKTSVFLLSCGTAGEDGRAFVHGNFANEVKQAFGPAVRVWASTTSVDGTTMLGDWVQL